MEIVNTNNSHVIVDTNVNFSTLRVSEAGYPLQVLVFPYTLIFSILVLVVHIRSQEESHRTNRYAFSRYAKLPQNPDFHKLMRNFEMLQHMKIQRKSLYSTVTGICPRWRSPTPAMVRKRTTASWTRPAWRPTSNTTASTSNSVPATNPIRSITTTSTTTQPKTTMSALWDST